MKKALAKHQVHPGKSSLEKLRPNNLAMKFKIQVANPYPYLANQSFCSGMPLTIISAMAVDVVSWFRLEALILAVILPKINF